MLHVVGREICCETSRPLETYLYKDKPKSIMVATEAREARSTAIKIKETLFKGRGFASVNDAKRN